MSQVKVIADSGGGTVSLKAPASTTGDADFQLTLPVDDGTANQYLKTDGSGALSWATVSTSISDDSIAEAKLDVSNAPTNGQFLQAQSGEGGGLTWAAAGGGGKVLAFASGSTTTNVTGSEDTWVDTGLTVSITPTTSSSTIYVTSFVMMFGSCKQDSSGSHDGDFNFRLRVTPSGGSEATVGEEQYCRLGYGINGTYNHYTSQKRWQFSMHEQYSNSSTTAKTFKLQFMEDNYTVLSMCEESGRAFINAMEVA